MNNTNGGLNLSPAQQEALINAASQKLGINREQIISMLKSGRVEGLAGKAGFPLQQYMNDPAAIERLLSDLSAQAIIKKLMKGG